MRKKYVKALTGEEISVTNTQHPLSTINTARGREMSDISGLRLKSPVSDDNVKIPEEISEIEM